MTFFLRIKASQGETHAPLPLKQINNQQKNAAGESDNEDHYFKFIGDTFGKPVMDEFKDVFQNQVDLQECTWRHEKQIQDLELKIDNCNQHHQ